MYFKTRACLLSLAGAVAVAIATVFIPPAQAAITDGLIVHYPLDGNADDVGGGGYNGTVYGATPTTDRFGNANSAYHFDGVNDYINTNFGSGVTYPNGISIQAWVKSTETGDGAIVVARGEAGGGAYAELLGIYAGADQGIPSMEVFMNDPSTRATALFTSSINDNKWHHIVGTYDGSSTASIYVDGVSVSTPSSVSAYSADVFRIGWDDWSSSESSRWFNGSIDDVRIWNRALSASEVASLFPEPSTLTLTMLGMAGLGCYRRRRA